MPNDDFDKYVTVDQPRRGKSHPNKIAFQPDDADWSLDRLGELDEFYRANYKRPLPLTNKGQGSVHNKLGYDHRNSADIAVNPSSPEGQRLMDEMRARKIPFLAFTGAIPGVSTGPHIHGGRPSHRTTNRYQVGAQVKRLGQVKTKPAPTPDDFDKYVSAEGASDDFDKYISQSAAAPPPKKLDISKVQGGVAAIAPRSPWEGVTAGANAPDTSIGALRRRDEVEVARINRIAAQVAEENRRSRVQRASGSEAQGLAQRYRERPMTVNSEVLKRVGAEKEAESRRRELIASLTDEDRATIREHVANMRAMGSVSRGIEKGSQRIGSGLLYKLAAGVDLAFGTETEFGKNRPNAPLSAYLRRQAGRGELDIEQIEAEMPPDSKEQWAEFLTQMVGSLPELYGATALGGPVGGFAALHGLESMGRGESAGRVALATVEGGMMGKMFGMAGRLPNIAAQGLAIGGGTVAIEKAFGAEDHDALRAAATNIAFHTAMKAPELVSRLTAAAERAYTTPDRPGSGARGPTVPETLQSRLSDIDAVRSQFDAIRAKGTIETPIPTPPIPPVRPSQPKEVAASEARTQEAGPTLAPTTITRPPERPAPGTQKPGESVPVVERRPLAELMAERAVSGPPESGLGERTGPDIQLTPKQEQRLQRISHNKKWYTERLADPKLFDRAITVGRAGTLTAVPVGGSRKLGLSDSAMSKAHALEVVKELQGKPGFPDVRVGSREEIGGKKYYGVEWGKRVDWRSLPDSELGKLLGYSPEAIAKHVLTMAKGGYLAGTPVATPKLDVKEITTRRRAELEKRGELYPTANAQVSDVTPKAAWSNYTKGVEWAIKNAAGDFDALEKRVDSKIKSALSPHKAVLTKKAGTDAAFWKGVRDAISEGRREPTVTPPVTEPPKFTDPGYANVGPEGMSIDGKNGTWNQRYGDKWVWEQWGKGAEKPLWEREVTDPSEIAKLNAAAAKHKADLEAEGFDVDSALGVTDLGAVDQPLRTKRKGEAGFIDPREISEGLSAGIEKVREKLGDEQLTGERGATIGAPLAHTRPDISGKPIVATTADGRAIVPNEANKSGISVVKPDATVRDAEGRPLTVYHGSVSRGFENLESREAVRPSTNPPGSISFHTDPRYALNYTRRPKASIKEPAGELVKANLTMQNPLDITDAVKKARKRGLSFGDAKREALKAFDPAVHDGIVFKGDSNNPAEYVVIRPDQIKRIDRKPARSPEAADREMLSRAGAEYQQRTRELRSHQASREGLDITNEDVAADYFTRLRRFNAKFAPERVSLVDQAENLYFQGKYKDAAARISGLDSLGEHYIDKLNAASQASYMFEKGAEPPARVEWRAIIEEVRKRRGETGPLSGGGSTFYDVNKFPEGGRPDHAKIAYILEPVIDGIRADAKRLITEGKLKTEEFTDYVRREFSKIVSGSDFADWHPLNRAAALGIVVDKLRAEGPPVGPAAPATTTAEPPTKARSLPKTIEASGREQIGTNTRYTPITGDLTEAKVAERIARDGAAKTEEWLRERQPESFAEEAERTEAFIQLSDAYQTEAVHLAATRPQEAGELFRHAIELNNREFERSTALGQGVQAYSRLKKYEPAHALLEAKRLSKKAGVPLKTTVAADITDAAVTFQKEAREVKRLKAKVAALEAESPQPTGAATGGGGPRARAAGKRRGESILPSKLEAAREQLTEAQARRRAAKRDIARRLAAIQQSRSFGGYWKRAQNMTRGLMVSQLSTAMRNLETQALRTGTERGTDFIEHGIRMGSKYSIDTLNRIVGKTLYDTVGLESDFTTRDIWRATTRMLDVIDGNIKLDKGVYTAAGQKAKDLLSEHPQELARMFNTYMELGEVPEAGNWRTIEHPVARNLERMFQTAERAVDTVNIFNRIQEHHIRSVEFMAELDLHLKKEHGVSLEQFVKRNGMDQVPQELITKAVNKALEVTFSAMPSRDGLGGQTLANLIKIGNYIPPTVSPVVFPRFLYNSAKFLYQYNPTGLFDVALTAGRNRGLSNRIKEIQADRSLTPEAKTKEIAELNAKKGNVPRAIARTLLGSSMLLLGYQFRDSDHAKDADGNRLKWYNLNLGGYVIDARPFGPFSTYLFFGEAIRRWKDGEKAFTVREILEAVGASTAPTGSGIVLVEKLYDLFSSGQLDKAMRLVKMEGGDLGRAILTPVRQIKELIGAFDESQAVVRDTSDAPFLGPMAESIPYATTDLPPSYRPTTAEPIRSTAKEGPLGIPPALIRPLGPRIEQSKSFLERQLDDLHFTPQEIRPNTGIGQLDALEKRLMGPLMDQLGAELEKDEAFKRMGKAARADYIHDRILDIRQDVRSMGKAEAPELYEQLKEERKPQRKKDLEREQREQEEENSPGLSSALRLGVPMPIPARSANEDDTSYRARLLQLGRRRRATLDTVASQLGFFASPPATQRKELYSALNRSYS